MLLVAISSFIQVLIFDVVSPISINLEERFHFKFWIGHKHAQILSIKNYGTVHSDMFSSSMDWILVSIKVHVNVEVLCCGIFGRWLGLDEVMGVEPKIRLVPLYMEEQISFLSLSQPCEDNKKSTSCNQEGCPLLTPDLQEPWFWISSLQNCENNGYLLFKAPSLWYSATTV